MESTRGWIRPEHAYIGMYEKLFWLLKHPKIDVNAQTTFGDTPLTIAPHNRKMRPALVLLTSHPNIKLHKLGRLKQSAQYNLLKRPKKKKNYQILINAQKKRYKTLQHIQAKL